MGIPTERDREEVCNLLVHLPGRRDGPRLMFSTYMDTAPIAVGCRPRLDKAGRIVNDTWADASIPCLLTLTLYLLAFSQPRPAFRLQFSAVWLLLPSAFCLLTPVLCSLLPGR